MESKGRIAFVDYYRGIGIILMIMAHIGFGSHFEHFIHAFHMPMFFFVSGYFFKIRRPKDFFRMKAKALLIPYIVYATILYYIWKLIFNLPDETIIHVLLFMNDTSFIAAALWFLPALFLANTLYFFIRSYIQREITVSLLVALIAIVGTTAHHLYQGAYIFAVDSAMVGLGFMHVGYYIHNTNNRLTVRAQKLRPLEIVVGFLCVSGLIFVNGSINMREGLYSIIPLFWINSIAMCIVLWNIAANVVKIKRLCFTRFIEYIGKHSLTFLCFNQVLIALFFMIWPVSGSRTMIVPVHNLLCLLAVVLTLYLLATLREKAIELFKKGKAKSCIK